MNREDVAESECVVSSSERNWTINWYQDKDETTPLAEIDVVAVSPPSKPAQSSLTKLGTTYSRTLYVPGAPENEGNYECKVESSLHKRAGVARTVNVTYSAPPTEALAKGTTPESWKSTTTTPTTAPTPSAFLLSTSSKAKSWIAAVVLAALFAVVLVVLALAYRRRQRAKRHAYVFQTVSVETKVALARRPSTIASSPVDKKAVKLSSMEFPRGKITLGDVLGKKNCQKIVHFIYNICRRKETVILASSWQRKRNRLYRVKRARQSQSRRFEVNIGRHVKNSKFEFSLLRRK